MTNNISNNNEKRAEILIKERLILKNEIVEFTKGMHRSIFALLTVAVFSLGALFTEKTANNANNREIILFSLFQAQMLLGFLVLSLTSMNNTRAGNIEALEKKINDLLGTINFIWESKITRKHLINKSASFLLSVSCIIIMLILLDIHIIIYLINSNINLSYSTLAIVELSFNIIILIKIYLERKNIVIESYHYLNETNKISQKR